MKMLKDKSIYKKAFILAVPMMIQNGITNMVSLVDNVMVGRLGTEPMTAVSIGGQLIFVFNLAVFGGLSGPGIYGAQFFGKGDMEGVKKVFGIKHLIGGFILLMGYLIFALGGDFLIGSYLKGESADIDPALTLSYAKEYLYIMLLGLLPFVITQIFASSLRETGDSIKPMTAGIVSVIADVLFNYLLIYGKAGFPALGVKGAAIATVISRYVEMIVVVVTAKSKSPKGIYRSMRVPLPFAGKVITNGLPIFFNELLWAGGIAAMTQAYSTRGLDIVAGLNISNAICNMLNVVFVSLGSAVGILIGQTLGAAQFEKAKRDAFSLTAFSGGICLILTAILVGISGVFPMLYDTSGTVREYATGFIIITACFFPVQGLMNALYFTLRSGGKTLITFLMDSVYSWVITVPAAVLLCRYSSLSIFAVYTIIQAADIIKVIIGSVLIKKGIWINDLSDTG